MDTSADLLSRFADAADPGLRRAALIDLIKTKQLHRVASGERFRHGLERLAGSARDAEEEADRLLAVAALLHAAATAPSIRASVESLVRNAVTGPLSKLHELPDVHDAVVRSQIVACRACRLESRRARDGRRARGVW